MTKLTSVGTTETYASAYATLSSIAAKPSGNAATTTIDTLALDIRAARQAHAICLARLEAVRREIETEVGAPQADT